MPRHVLQTNCFKWHCVVLTFRNKQSLYESVISGYRGHFAGHMRRDLREVLCVQGCTSPQIFTERLLYNSGHMTVSRTHANVQMMLQNDQVSKTLHFKISESADAKMQNVTRWLSNGVRSFYYLKTGQNMNEQICTKQ